MMKASQRAGLLDRQTAKRVRQLRQSAGLSQGELAGHMGVTFQQVQKYEKGVNRISVGRAILLCEALNIRMEDLIAEL